MPPSRLSRKVLRVVSRRGSFEVLAALAQGPVRFSDLEARLGMAPRTLSERLREFAALGLVRREAFSEVPPRVEYALTPRGRKILDFFEAMDSVLEGEE
ncbi:winged helix-turn-helix transcriptional regulator [Thermus filiformis]|uniref:HxlR family transcriptional regulator n=1 Tax=Thermus filiformis TaxID=276 RepID=A0A0D6X9L9_THEFI|nr:helix-turn-helix domain-containing protein [Thermus filiformis]KIX84387.1 HxlR family transcriptional regulator [Thermus filiformis]